MRNIHVDYSELLDTAKSLDAGRHEIANILSAMQAKVSHLTASGYRTDKASGQFEEAYRQLNTGIAQAVAGMQVMSEYLRASVAAFNEQDVKMAGAIRR